jgi:tetratricopeptide (TPR) repeat protein
MIRDACRAPGHRYYPELRLEGDAYAQPFQAMALISRGHADAIPATVTNSYSVPGGHIRLELLQWLLRVGDALDAEADRVNHDWVSGKWTALQPKDRYHALKHQFVSSVDVVGAGVFQFNYALPPRLKRLLETIHACASHCLRKHLEENGSHIRELGLPFSEVKCKLLPGDIVCPYPIARDVIRYFVVEGGSKPPSTSLLSLAPTKPDIFVNRIKYIPKILADLRSGRLVHIKGPPGIGKTELATVIAHRMEGSRRGAVLFFLWFHKRTIEQLYDEIASRLTGKRLECNTDDKKLVVADLLSRSKRELLIILDNVERPQEGALKEFLAIRALTPVLLTSRLNERLSFAREKAYFLPQLDEDDAAQLLRSRSDKTIAPAQARAMFRAISGLPLVLNLTAGLLKSPDAKEFLAMVQANPAILLRHESAIKAVFDDLYTHLSSAEQELFRLFGLFSGETFSADAISAISDDPDAGTLLYLSFKPSTLIKEHTIKGRFFMHPLIKSYAEARLKASPLEDAYDRMITYYLEFVRKSANKDLLKIESGNIFATIQYAEARKQYQVVVEFLKALNGQDAYYGFFGRNGLWEEGIRWTTMGMVAAQRIGNKKLQAVFSRDVALFCYWLGQNPDARLHCNVALKVFKQTRATLEVIKTYHILGYIEDDEDAYTEARDLYETALRLARRIRDREMIALGHHLVGVIDYHQKKYPDARASFVRSLVLFKELGNTATTDEERRHYEASEARCKRRFAALARMQGHYATGISRAAFLREAMKLIEWALEHETGDRSRARGLRQKGMIHEELHEINKAASCYTESLDLFMAIGSIKGVGCVKCNMGSIAMSKGKLDKADEMFKESCEIAERVNSPYGQAMAMMHRGIVFVRRGDVESGCQCLKKSYTLLKKIQSPFASDVKELLVKYCGTSAQAKLGAK